MKAPLNRRVFVVGYAAATPLGATFERTFARAAKGEAGFRRVTLCEPAGNASIVGEIPDFDPTREPFLDEREIKNWNARFVSLTMVVCRDALLHAGLPMNESTGPRTACLIGSSLNGHDAYRAAMLALSAQGPNRVSPFLLPNLCANLPAGKAGILLGFTGPVFSPQGACASGNHAMGIGARMIRDGDIDFALCGGVDAAILPEILWGFANMNALFKTSLKDRAANDPACASRPFSIDRKGFVLSEGAAVLVLAAEEKIREYGLDARAEILGVGYSSDAHHVTAPHAPTIVRAMRDALDDAGLRPDDIQYVNAHGTSTPKGDANEIACLREVFGSRLARLPVSSNKSQLGHTLGASAAIEAALTIEGMRRGLILPTINHLPDPSLGEIDVVPNATRRQAVELAMSNAFGFGGTNCSLVLKGVS